MKPRRIADLVGFITYFYIVNRRLPERRIIRLAMRQSDTSVPVPAPFQPPASEMTAMSGPPRR